MALFLVFPSMAAAQAWTQQAAATLGCDGVLTKFWWALTQDQASAKAAAIISDMIGGFGQNILPANATAALQTAAQLTAAGWVFPKDAGGATVIPAFSSAEIVPAAAAKSSPISFTASVV